jgi:hypothetical protein
LHTLPAVEERRSAGDQQIQSGESPDVHLVDQLAQCVERLGSRVAADPLQGFHLVEHQEQPGVSGIAQHSEQPLQEPQRKEMVEITLHACGPSGRCGDVRLAGQPGGDGVRGAHVLRGHRPPVAAQAGGVARRGTGETAEPPLEQLVDCGTECISVVGAHRSVGEDVLFQRVEPGIEHRPERAGLRSGGGEAFTQSPVHRLQPVQRCLGLGDLYLGHGHPAGFGAFTEPAGEEGLARAVLAAHRGERRRARGAPVQFGIGRRSEAVETDGEQVQPLSGTVPRRRAASTVRRRAGLTALMTSWGTARRAIAGRERRNGRRQSHRSR